MQRWWWLFARRCVLVLMVLQTITLALWMTLAYDDPIRLAVRFNTQVFTTALSSPFHDLGWLKSPPAFPITLSDDLALVVKSGFGTKERIPGWLDMHRSLNLSNVLLVGDFASPLGISFSVDGYHVAVHDMVEEMKDVGSIPKDMVHSRLRKYADLKSAVSRGDEDAARALSRSFGWELDALKFISGLELCYHQMPNKKWYLMLDDDTYLVQPSLKLLLDHLDPSVPYYIGNAVGDYKARFAHGGSGVILSHAAIRKLFSHPKVVAAAHLESLDETWGDRLLATTLVKLGVYLDESFVTFFNGENPSKTKLTWQRFCSPIISFHSLTSPEEMETASRVSKNATSPVRWMDLWDVSGAPPLDSPTWDSGHEDWDHVGRLDETVMVIDKISNQQDCARICTTRKTCLAWTWESKTRACHLSPWMIPGERAVGKVSGIKVPRVKAMLGSVDCAGY